MKSKNFSSIEFFCKCGCGTQTENKSLLWMAQAIRDYVKKPIIVHCTVRCEKHNAKVGGGINSRHLPKRNACAMDFHVRGLSNWKLRSICKKLWRQKIILTGGLGLYSWGVHIDTSTYRKWGNFWNK